MRRSLLVLLTTVLAVPAGAAAGTANLIGPSSVRPLDKVTFTAHGLLPGRYALRATRSLIRDRRRYRCEVYLAAARHAEGREQFRGSFPSGMTCVTASGPVKHFRTERSVAPGTWQAVVCHPGPRQTCAPDASVLRRGLRVLAAH